MDKDKVYYLEVTVYPNNEFDKNKIHRYTLSRAWSKTLRSLNLSGHLAMEFVDTYKISTDDTAYFSFYDIAYLVQYIIKHPVRLPMYNKYHGNIYYDIKVYSKGSLNTALQVSADTGLFNRRKKYD